VIRDSAQQSLSWQGIKEPAAVMISNRKSSHFFIGAKVIQCPGIMGKDYKNPDGFLQDEVCK
jgi:hypothetical protein